MRKLIATVVFFLLLAPAMAVGEPTNTNDPNYWVGQFEGAIACYKHEADSQTGHGYITEDGLAVVLNEFNPSWPGDRWAGLVVKSGSVDIGYGPGNAVYPLPQAGVPYYGPLNAGGEQGEVSHWIVCKGETPTSTTTSTPPSTTSSTTTSLVTTTTEPPTTTTLPGTTTTTSTTSTTAPPGSTTTTSPPVTTTTEGPTTTTSEPPEEVCDENHWLWNEETQSCIPTGVPTGNGGMRAEHDSTRTLFGFLLGAILGGGIVILTMWWTERRIR